MAHSATATAMSTGPFQDHLAYSGLMGAVPAGFHLAALGWARWANGQVEAWPDDLAKFDARAGFARIVAATENPWAGL